jgi:hypothetical protein
MADQPMNPLAGPAGPGPFATRTDQLKFKSDTYGAGVENAANMAGAPLAKTGDVRPESRSAMGMAPSQLAEQTDFFAKSSRPGEEVTTGIAIGPGAGPEALAMTGVQREKLSDILATMLPYDQSGEVEILYQRALARGM